MRLVSHSYLNENRDISVDQDDANCKGEGNETKMTTDEEDASV